MKLNKIEYDIVMALDGCTSFIEVESTSIDIRLSYIDTNDLPEDLYNEFYQNAGKTVKQINKKYQNDKYSFDVGYDGSGWDYWQNESNYLFLCVNMENDHCLDQLTSDEISILIERIRMFEGLIAIDWAETTVKYLDL